jgi:hypothetical protein
MNDKLLKLLPEFETLLKEKSFKELNSFEKSAVAKFITPEEYETMKEIVKHASDAFSLEELNLKPDGDIEKSLIKHLRIKKENPPNWFIKAAAVIFNFRIPAYQVVILLIVGLLFIKKSYLPVKSYFTTSVHVDTVYVVKPVLGQLALYKNKNNLRHQSGNIKIRNSDKLYNPYSLSYANIVTQSQIERRGLSVQSDSNLYNHLVSVQ